MSKYTWALLTSLLLICAGASADTTQNLFAHSLGHSPELSLEASSDTAGQYFTANHVFNRVAVHCFTWGPNPGRGFTMRLYNWAGSWAASVGGTPIASQVFANIADNADVVMNIAVPVPAGEYLLTFTDRTGDRCGPYVYTQSGFNNGFAFRNGVPLETIMDNNAADTPASNAPHNFGQRFQIPNSEYARIEYRVYTYSQNPGSPYTVYLYPWNNNYGTTVAGAPIQTLDYESGVPDNSTQTWNWGGLNGNTYLMRLEAPQPNMGWWRHSSTNNYTNGQAYLDGATVTGGYFGRIIYNSRDINGRISKVTPPKPPAPTLDPADDSGISNSDNITSVTSNLTIIGTAEPLATVLVYDNGTQIASGAANAAGNYSIDVNLPAEGVHPITVAARDALNQTSPQSDPLNITIDTTSPTVSSVVVQTGLTVDVTFDELMGAGATTASNYVVSGTGQGVLAEHPSNVTLVSGNTYRLTWTSPDEMLNGGNIVVTVTNVQDVAGNPVGTPNSAAHVGGAIGVPPVISDCGPDQTINATVGCQGETPDLTGNVVASDDRTPAGELNFFQAPTAGTLLGLGDHVITITVHDAAKNEAVCQVTVTVEDTTPPVITDCGPNQTVSVNASCQAAVPDFTGAVVASDNCTPVGELSVSQSPTAGTLVGPGEYAITITVRDAANNEDTCQRTLIVEDTTPPVIADCGPNQTVSVNAGCQAAVPDFTGMVVASDNCTSTGALSILQSPTAGTLVGPGEHTITITVRDEEENENTCQVTLTVEDTTPPVISDCGPNQTISADANCQAAVPNFTGAVAASDNCTSEAQLSITQLPTAGTLVGPGEHTITITVRDEEDNEDVCHVLLTVEDATPPEIAFADVILEVECGDAVVFPTPATSDNCGPITVSLTEDDGLNVDIAAVGDYVVEFTAEDGANNTASATVTVEVRDTLPPVISIPGPNPHYALLGAAYVPPAAEALDACEGPVVPIILDDGGLDTNALGVYEIVYIAQDSGGRSATETLFVHVTEDLPPVITLIGDVSVTLNCGAIYADAGATAEDDVDGNLTGQILTTGLPPADTPLGPGIWTIEYNVTDSGGKPAETVTRTVIVEDNCTLEVMPVGQVNFIKEPGASVTFTVEVSGAVGEASYQWKHNPEDKSFAPIVGANDSYYTIDPIAESDAGEYMCEVSDAVTTVTSTVFTLSLGTGLPAAGLFGLALAAALSACVGVRFARKRNAP